MRGSAEADQHPWTRPWYSAAGGAPSIFVYLIVIHVLSAAGLALFPLPGWPVFLTALALTALGGLGTTVAYHRSIAHRALRLNPILEQILIFCAVFNGSGVPTRWAANHRKHHAHADTVEDVSSPRHGGFWWAHLRCLYQMRAESPGQWCPDLIRKRYQVWDTVQVPLIIASLAGGWFLFGWAGFFWIGAIRLTYALHLQAVVNSILHLKKGVPEGKDCARNIGWLGPFQLTAWGENWHENHHARPGSARFSAHWWQVDIGWYAISLLRILGLATKVRV